MKLFLLLILFFILALFAVGGFDDADVRNLDKPPVTGPVLEMLHK